MSKQYVRCPICGSIEVEKRGNNYNCKQCKTKFTVDQYPDDCEEE